MSLRRPSFDFLRRLRLSLQTAPVAASGRTTNALIQTDRTKLSHKYGYGRWTWNMHNESYLWILLSAQAVLVGTNSSTAFADNVSLERGDEQGGNLVDLRKIDDGSIISNIHTSKWRVFTDSGRDLFLQGKLEEAENLFLAALQEAKEGFGETDPHVASAYNNLAELYRVKKAYDKAEPLYLEAIKILEESFGLEDIRVGSAVHNLGQFFLVQRKLEKARMCYERALKIKRRVLGHSHLDYAETMFHLGMVLYLQGKEDSETFIRDSVRILEDGGQGESITCVKRLRYLAQIYIKSNKLGEAENVQRKILHIMELSKGWNSLETVAAAEALALTLQPSGNLKEAKDLLERCLEVRKALLPGDHIQVATNLFYIASLEMLNSNRLVKVNTSEAIIELDKAKSHLSYSIRIARRILAQSAEKEDKQQSFRKNDNAALLQLLQSLDALGDLEITEQELQESGEYSSPIAAEDALRQCISTYKEFGIRRSPGNSPGEKAAYLSCMKRLANLIGKRATDGIQQTSGPTLQELKDEIKRVESELSHKPKGKHNN